MRTWSAILMCLAASWAQAQITVQLNLEQDQFLRDESLPLSVRIENRSGQPLALGETDEWLTFSLERTDHRFVLQKRPVDVIKPFTLQSAASAVKYLDLMSSYDLSQPGRYTVRAQVKVPGWDQSFESATKTFDIGRGVESWSEEVGVPSKQEGPVELRRYGLVQANYKSRPMLYARVTDPSENEVYGVIPLGPVVSFTRSEKLIDRQSNLHLLFQTGARSFLYCVVSPSGQRMARQTYSQFRDRPTLRNEGGEVQVTGGLRRLAPDDFPPPSETQPSLTDAKSPVP